MAEPGADAPLDADDAEFSIEIFLRQAEIFRQKQAYGDLLKTFHLALKEFPTDLRLLHGLAQAYEAQAGVSFDGKALLRQAVDGYWRVISLDPADTAAHDGLVAAALKADLVEEVFETYRERAKQFPDVPAYRDAIKKIQAVLTMRVDRPLETPAVGGLVNTVFARITPLAGLLSLATWGVITALKKRPEGVSKMVAAVGVSLGRAGIVLVLCYAGYLFYRRLQSASSR
jgi:tetratricopeptide (TPR) repeat protein